MDDTDGEEKVLIHTKDGAMRLVLDKAKGLSIVKPYAFVFAYLFTHPKK